MLRQALSALLLLTVAGCAASSPPASPVKPVILISIDGFRPDYLDRGVTPTLNSLAAEGVRAEAMYPSFPSITFPNHYTLVTGLRPDHHGIVANSMEDPAIPNEQFSLRNRDVLIDPRWWNEAEPIWVTAEKHGVHSSTMFWPGSEVAIHGVRPSDWMKFDSHMTGDARVDTLLGWFDRPAASQPRFATLYFDIVDHEGHLHGPDSQEVTDASASVDHSIGRLLEGLKQRHIDADIIVVSDHGMAGTSHDRVIALDKIAPAGSFRVVTAGAYAGIEPLPNKEAQLSAALLRHHDHLQCWHKENIPERFHYGSNPRVPSFICLADPDWMVLPSAKSASHPDGGDHGYDNMAPEMHATFIAEGPDFGKGVKVPAFDNVDVYPLVMTLLGLQPLPSDGVMPPGVTITH